MTTDKQPTGNFTMNLNFARNGNKKAPPITGRISTPEDRETEFTFKAFRQDGEKGRYWIGPVDMTRTLRQGLSETALRGHKFVAIRENGFKVFKELEDGSRNPAYEALSTDDKAKADALPSFWAKWTRNPETDPVLDAFAWEREPTRYGPWASGNTQHHQTREELAGLGNEPVHTEHGIETMGDVRARSSRGKARAGADGR